jgi:hypothetical protein
MIKKLSGSGSKEKKIDVNINLDHQNGWSCCQQVSVDKRSFTGVFFYL